MREIACDVAVIGAGTAGIAAYRAARKAGARTLLIEAGPGGTTCARVGCMPSKLLIEAASAAQAARDAGLFGLHVPEVGIDGRAVLERVRRERDRFVRLVFEDLETFPDGERIAGRARFLDRDRLAVGEDLRVRFRAAVIATGSSPAVPKPLAGLGARVLTTDTVFELPDLPRTLAVIGGGPVGIELAQAMARLGIETTLIEGGRSLAGLSEPGLVAEAAEIFGRELTLHLETEVEEADCDGLRLRWCAPRGEPREARFERVLAAAGRPPNVTGLGLEAAGLDLDGSGVPRFDPGTLRCGDAPVFVAGDANADRPVLHEASRQGGIVGVNAAALAGHGGSEAPRRWPPLALVFTHPQAGRFGAAYDPEAGDGRLTGRASFADQGRARIAGTNAGGAVIFADRSGRLLGGEMLGPGAEHLVQGLAQAVWDGRTVQDLLDRPVYHPTLEEGLSDALRQIGSSIS